MKVTNNSWGGGGFSQACTTRSRPPGTRAPCSSPPREQQPQQRPAAVLPGVVRPRQRDRGRGDDEHGRPRQLLELRRHERRPRRPRRRHHVDGPGQRLRVLVGHVDGDAARLRAPPPCSSPPTRAGRTRRCATASSAPRVRSPRSRGRPPRAASSTSAPRWARRRAERLPRRRPGDDARRRHRRDGEAQGQERLGDRDGLDPRRQRQRGRLGDGDGRLESQQQPSGQDVVGGDERRPAWRRSTPVASDRRRRRCSTFCVSSVTHRLVHVRAGSNQTCDGAVT